MSPPIDPTSRSGEPSDGAEIVRRSDPMPVGSAARVGGGRRLHEIEKWGPSALVLVVLGGALLRLRELTVWWANPDEGLYTLIVTQPTTEAFWEEVLATAHPPAYFAVLRALDSIAPGLTALRSLSLAAGMLAIVACFLAARELGEHHREARSTEVARHRGGWIAGLAAAALVAFGPRTVTLSQVVRPYMLLIALLALSLYWLLRYLRRPTWTTLGGYVGATSLACALHYSAPFAIAAFAVVVLGDGAARGWRRRSWLRLAVAHAVPAGVLAGLYVLHLRGLMASSMADNAQQGWLGGFMIGSPADVWPSLVGVHSMTFGRWAAGAGAAALLGGIVYAVRRGAYVPMLLGLVPLALGVVLALVGAYPLGATRHSSWFVLFSVVLPAWLLATLFGTPGRTVGRRALVLAAVVVLGVGADVAWAGRSVPREIAERVVRTADLERLGEALDPDAPPRLAVMSNETYQTLFSLFGEGAYEREYTPDGLVFRFRWGGRHVVVSPSRDFTALPAGVGERNHILTVMEKARASFDGLPPPGAEPVLLLAAGWRSTGMDELAALAQRSGAALGSAVAVPGATAVYLDWSTYEGVVLGGR